MSIADLPAKYQRQALLQLQQQEETKAARRKYGNQPTERAGISFDSKKEARRFEELLALLHAAVIRDLRLQVDFTLQEAYTTPTGERVRAIRYKADFTYYRRDGQNEEYVVEDVKSKATRTKTYMMKKKLMQERRGITIAEV